ncbi:MAG: hypothetical protein HY287_08370 [Planctomycetes bacterium]|nr:hypothetical protein [Planctomycetota bacterium]MBI3834328.1 hypothetical protein [Planctomycetota bacterium]
MSKKEKPVVEELGEVPIPDDVLEVIPVVGDLPMEPDGGPAAAKRSIGPKEPIPFKWKIVGTADRYVLTLFKSVEREDADAQLERLSKEGYYTGLRVTDIHEKIEQPVQKEAKKSKPAKNEPAEKSSKATRHGKTSKPARRDEKSANKDRTVRITASKSSIRKSSKAAEKSVVKTAKSSKKKSAGGKPSKAVAKRR